MFRYVEAFWVTEELWFLHGIGKVGTSRFLCGRTQWLEERRRCVGVGFLRLVVCYFRWGFDVGGDLWNHGLVYRLPYGKFMLLGLGALMRLGF